MPPPKDELRAVALSCSRVVSSVSPKVIRIGVPSEELAS